MRDQRIFGQDIAGPRLTPLGAALVALALAVPGGLIIGLAAWALGA